MAAFTGCSDGQIERTSDGVRIWLHEPGLASGGEDAIVAGSVVYDSASNCMFLEVGGARWPVIWPSGAVITEQNPVMLRVGDDDVMEGDFVEGGGGWHRVDRYEDLIPAKCHGPDGDVAVFNADSSIEVTGR